MNLLKENEEFGRTIRHQWGGEKEMKRITDKK
jgi:hypothetical protein